MYGVDIYLNGYFSSIFSILEVLYDFSLKLGLFYIFYIFYIPEWRKAELGLFCRRKTETDQIFLAENGNLELIAKSEKGTFLPRKSE